MELENFYRSKYVEADLGSCFLKIKEYLKTKIVLFSGLPCQIAGLNAFLKKPQKNLITIELICNSIPSNAVWGIYKKNIQYQLGEKILNFNFRGKDYGWQRGIFAIKTKTKTKIIPHSQDSFMMGFLYHLTTRPSCDNCFYKNGVSKSDITLGDFWGLRGEFSDELGVSCALFNTQKAKNIFEKIKGHFEILQTSFDSIASGNLALIKSGVSPKNKLKILKNIIEINAKSGAQKAIKYLESQNKKCANAAPKINLSKKLRFALKIPQIEKFIKKILKRDKNKSLAIMDSNERLDSSAQKIAIVTFIEDNHNYGQVLQAYGLQRYIKNNFNVDVATLFYGFANMQDYAKRRDFAAYLKKKIIYKLTNPFIKLINYPKRRKAKKERILAMKNAKSDQIWDEIYAYNESAKDKRAFEKFKFEFMNLAWNPFCKYDIFIAGSDQIWNCWDEHLNALEMRQSYIDYFTLGFVKKAKKLSYAASMGKESLPNLEQKIFFKQNLSSFSAISVREKMNVETLRELGLNAICVPDPTMLLTRNDWEKIALKPNAIENAMFVYMLGNETIIDKDAALGYLEALNVNFVYANANILLNCKWDKNCDFFPTPQEWLGAVQNAKMMLTNSFHGCVFAIIFNTPFFVLELGGKAGAMNTRIFSLLSILGLEDRIVGDFLDFKMKFKKNAPIDWESVNEKLQAWRNVGVEFLKQNLK